MTEPAGAQGRSSPSPPRSEQNAILIVLSVAAGCVDAVSFLGLGQVLTAAMTGNTVLLGLALGQAELQAALRATIALTGFFAGVLLGASIVGQSAGRIWSAAVVAALGVELVLLLALATSWHLAEGYPWVETRFALIAMAGLAMGIQSAIAHRIGVAGIASTYVTGTLAIVGTRLAGWLRRRSRRGAPVEQAASYWLPAMVWLAYGVGAVLAGAAYRWWSLVTPVPGVDTQVQWSSAALLLPIVIVTTVALMVWLGQRHRSAHA
jgi:uncharacterized membrane protein YoaK (UPF0700 family)